MKNALKISLIQKRLPYERAVYLFGYKNCEFQIRFQKTILDINLACLFPDGGNERDIRTKKLNAEEKTDLNLDFIGGIQIIDMNYRLFILEGLANGSMDELAKRLPKSQNNSVDFKVMKNPNMTFSSRLYVEFDIDLKRIKLRRSINSLTNTPEIYMKSLVSEELYQTIDKIKKLRDKNEIHEIIASNLWPDQKEIIILERHYGDALNEFDLYGIRIKKKKAKLRGRRSSYQKQKAQSVEAQNSHSDKRSMVSLSYIKESYLKGGITQSSTESTNNKGVDMTRINSSYSGKRDESYQIGDISEEQKLAQDSISRIISSSLKENAHVYKKSADKKSKDKVSFALDGRLFEKPNDSMLHETKSPLMPDIIKTKRDDVSNKVYGKRIYEAYNLRQKMPLTKQELELMNLIRKDVGKGETVYMTQLRRQRELVKNDRENFYTWSEKHFSLSIDPYTEKDVEAKKLELHNSKFLTPDGFQLFLKKYQKSETMTQSMLYDTPLTKDFKPQRDDSQKLEKITNTKLHKDKFFCFKQKTRSKKFFPKLKKVNVTSDNIEQKDIENYDLTYNSEVQRREQLKEKKEWESKMVVSDKNFKVNLHGAGTYSYDKYKGLIKNESDIKKKGLIMRKKYQKDNEDIQIASTLRNLPISYNLGELKMQSIKPVNHDFKKFVKRTQDDEDFDLNCKRSESFNYVYKPKYYDAFSRLSERNHSIS